MGDDKNEIEKAVRQHLVDAGLVDAGGKAVVQKAPVVIAAKKPQGWADILLSKIGSAELDKLAELDPGLAEYAQELKDRRSQKDRRLKGHDLHQLERIRTLLQIPAGHVRKVHEEHQKD